MSKNICLDVTALVPGPGTTRWFRGSGGQADVLCYCQVQCTVVISGILCKAKESQKNECVDNGNPPAKFITDFGG